MCFSFPSGKILISMQLCLSALLSYLQRDAEDLLCARYYPECFLCPTSFNLTLFLLFLLWQTLVYKGASPGKTMQSGVKVQRLSKARPPAAWASRPGTPLWWPFWEQFRVWEGWWYLPRPLLNLTWFPAPAFAARLEVISQHAKCYTVSCCPRLPGVAAAVSTALSRRPSVLWEEGEEPVGIWRTMASARVGDTLWLLQRQYLGEAYCTHRYLQGRLF